MRDITAFHPCPFEQVAAAVAAPGLLYVPSRLFPGTYIAPLAGRDSTGSWQARSRLLISRIFLTRTAAHFA